MSTSAVEISLFLVRDILWSAIAALGFAFVFNVPRRALWGCALGGALGHLLRTLSVWQGANLIPATLVGAVAIGILGEVLSRRWRMPGMVITVSSAIPLVPGSFAFQAMIGLLLVAGTDASSPLLLQARLVEAGVNLITTGLILGAIALGIAAPSFILNRRRPVV